MKTAKLEASDVAVFLKICAGLFCSIIDTLFSLKLNRQMQNISFVFNAPLINKTTEIHL